MLLRYLPQPTWVKPPPKSCAAGLRTPELLGNAAIAVSMLKPSRTLLKRSRALGGLLVVLSLLTVSYTAVAQVNAGNSPALVNKRANGGIGGTGSGGGKRFGLVDGAGVEQFSFNSEDLKALQFSRNNQRELPTNSAEHQTALQFRLRPGKFDFSLEGGFGLGGVFSHPEFEMRSGTTRRRDIDDNLPELHEGLSYSAGVNVEHEQAHISDTAYVSSSQLGLSYGRLGRVWYNGLDLSLQQMSDGPGAGSGAERLSFDITTGRKVSWTGVGSHDPLWLLTLRGDFDIQDGAATSSFNSSDADWYLNPSLFWQTPDFKFSAQLEVPITEDLLSSDPQEPDYRLRAIIEKSFK